MATIKDYVKGIAPIVLVIGDGVTCYVCKQECRDSYLFMNGEEVVMKRYFSNDLTNKLVVRNMNKRLNADEWQTLASQPVYQAFKKFYLEQTGKEWTKL